MEKRTEINQALCDHARILMAGGATTAMVADMLGIGKSTVQKMRQAGFDAAAYKKMKEEEKKKMVQQEEPAEEKQEVPGQIKMQFAEDPDESFDKNVKAVLETMAEHQKMFQDGMQRIQEQMDKLKAERMEAYEGRRRLHNVIGILKGAMEEVRQELII